MSLPLVPVESLSGPFREKVDGVVALGGDTSFFQFAANAPDLISFDWGDFYQGAFFAGRVPRRLKQLVRLRLAGHSVVASAATGGPQRCHHPSDARR